MSTKHPTPVVAPATLALITAKVSELRDKELEIESATERLKALNADVYKLEHETLPDLLADAGIRTIGIPAHGNMPAYDLKLKPYYSANIAASWEPERRAEAFTYLEKEGAQDLIKTQITINVPREERDEVKQLVKQLEEWSPDVKETVHSGTLTSWLKEKSEAKEEVKLSLIGGTIGTIVVAKPVKQEK